MAGWPSDPSARLALPMSAALVAPWRGTADRCLRRHAHLALEGLRGCHPLADSLDQLHEFAARIGLPWYACQAPYHLLARALRAERGAQRG
jgi:hypothetical protein